MLQWPTPLVHGRQDLRVVLAACQQGLNPGGELERQCCVSLRTGSEAPGGQDIVETHARKVRRFQSFQKARQLIGTSGCVLVVGL